MAEVEPRCERVRTFLHRADDAVAAVITSGTIESLITGWRGGPDPGSTGPFWFDRVEWLTDGKGVLLVIAAGPEDEGDRLGGAAGSAGLVLTVVTDGRMRATAATRVRRCRAWEVVGR